MHSLTRFIFTALAVTSFTRADGDSCGGDKPCPTVTTTGELCSTCIVPACLALSTISNPPDCPPTIATETLNFPCDCSSCPSGCETSYIYASTYTEGPPVTLTPTACPTVTSVATRCSTCVLPACLSIVTIKSQCGCPAAVPTITTSYACGEKCPGGCMGTSYLYDTATPDCDSASACVPTVTVTEHPGTDQGCKFDCSNEFCITDKFVELPCGCTSAEHVVTKTETVCASQSPCWNCHTGFPFTTTATDCAYPTPNE